MSVSAELLCSFELLKPLDSSALKSHIKKGRNKRQSMLNSPVSLAVSCCASKAKTKEKTHLTTVVTARARPSTERLSRPRLMAERARDETSRFCRSRRTYSAPHYTTKAMRSRSVEPNSSSNPKRLLLCTLGWEKPLKGRQMRTEMNKQTIRRESEHMTCLLSGHGDARERAMLGRPARLDR